MQTHSDNCISSLAYSLANNIVINVFNMTSLRAKFILFIILHFAILRVFLSILIFLHLISQRMRMLHLNSPIQIQLLLRYMLLHELLSFTKITWFLFIFIILYRRLCTMMNLCLRRGLSISLILIYIDYPPWLPIHLLVLYLLRREDYRLTLIILILSWLWLCLRPIINIACFVPGIWWKMVVLLMNVIVCLNNVDQMRLTG